MQCARTNITLVCVCDAYRRQQMNKAESGYPSGRKLWERKAKKAWAEVVQADINMLNLTHEIMK